MAAAAEALLSPPSTSVSPSYSRSLKNSGVWVSPFGPGMLWPSVSEKERYGNFVCSFFLAYSLFWELCPLFKLSEVAEFCLKILSFFSFASSSRFFWFSSFFLSLFKSNPFSSFCNCHSATKYISLTKYQLHFSLPWTWLQRTVDSSRQIYTFFSPQHLSTVHLPRTAYVFMCSVLCHKSNDISLEDTNWRLQSFETAPRRPQFSDFPASLTVSPVCYSAAKTQFLNRWSMEELLLW